VKQNVCPLAFSVDPIDIFHSFRGGACGQMDMNDLLLCSLHAKNS